MFYILNNLLVELTSKQTGADATRKQEVLLWTLNKLNSVFPLPGDTLGCIQVAEGHRSVKWEYSWYQNILMVVSKHISADWHSRMVLSWGRLLHLLRCHQLLELTNTKKNNSNPLFRQVTLLIMVSDLSHLPGASLFSHFARLSEE